MTGAERYRVDVPSGAIDDLRARRTRVRLPDEPPRPGWQDGTDQRTLNRLLRRRRHEYDWAAHQEALNELPHFRVVLEAYGPLGHGRYPRGSRDLGHKHRDAIDVAPCPLLARLQRADQRVSRRVRGGVAVR